MKNKKQKNIEIKYGTKVKFPFTSLSIIIGSIAVIILFLVMGNSYFKCGTNEAQFRKEDKIEKSE